MEEKKPNRTGAIIGTIAAILLCGCPGLSLCVLGFGEPLGHCLMFGMVMGIFRVGLGLLFFAWH